MLDGGTIQRPMGAATTSANYAPVEPLRKLKDVDRSYENSRLNEIIREMHNEITNRYIESRRERVEIGRLNANVRSGKLTMKRDPLLGTLALLTPLAGRPRNDRHVYPLAQVNSSQLTSIWTLSRPKVMPRHFGSNNKAQIQHALIQKVIEHYDAANFDEHFHQNQSLEMMDYGTSAIRIFYDDKLNAMHRLKPIIENVDQTVYAGFGFCRACMADGDEQKFTNPRGGMNQCPDCGSYDVSDLTPAQIASVPQITGAEEISQGDVGCELVHIPALNWDERKMIHESSYIQYRSEVPQRLVESILGIEVAEDNPEDDFGLSSMNALGTRGGSVEGWGRDNGGGNASWSSGVSVMDEEWFMPEWYAGRKLDEDEMTVCGKSIPKGVPLEKIFPDAMCVVGFNNMEKLTWVGNEKPRFRSGVYHIQSHSGVGKGTSDSIEISEQLNIAHSANLAVLKRYGAGGGYAYDSEAMTPKQAKALLKPDGLVGLKLRGTRYTSVDQAIKQLEHRPQNQESLALVAQLTNLLNICFQTTEFTGGVANDKIDINTLGGQQMLQAQNQQRSAAPLRMKGYLFAGVMEEVLDLFREKIKFARPFGTNDAFALAKVRFISGEDVPESVKCDFVPDSELPTNTLTKQQAAVQMLEKSQYLAPEGGFMALTQFSPRLASWWVSMFPGVEIPLFNQTEILIVCQERLDSIAEISAEVTQRTEISGFFPPLEEAAQEVIASLPRSVAMSEENHIVKAEVLKEYLDDDEVKEWPPLQRASVEALIQLHYAYDRDNRFRIPALDQEGQINLAMQAQQAQLAAAAPMVEKEKEDQMMQGGLEVAAEEVQKTLDFSRNEEAADAASDRKIREIEKQNEGRKQSGSPNSSRRKK